MIKWLKNHYSTASEIFSFCGNFPNFQVEAFSNCYILKIGILSWHHLWSSFLIKYSQQIRLSCSLHHWYEIFLWWIIPCILYFVHIWNHLIISKKTFNLLWLFQSWFIFGYNVLANLSIPIHWENFTFYHYSWFQRWFFTSNCLLILWGVFSVFSQIALLLFFRIIPW